MLPTEFCSCRNSLCFALNKNNFTNWYAVFKSDDSASDNIGKVKEQEAKQDSGHKSSALKGDFTEK